MGIFVDSTSRNKKKRGTVARITHLVVSFFKEINVMVEKFNEKLNLNRIVHALVGDFDSLLQAFCHSFPIMHLSRKQTDRQTNQEKKIKIQEKKVESLMNL